MSDSFWDGTPDIWVDLPVSLPRKKSKKEHVEYPAVSLFGTQEDASKVLRTLDEWLDTDIKISYWQEIVDTALHKIEVYEAQWENNRERCFPLDLLRSSLRGQELEEVLREDHQIIQLLGTRYSQGRIRDFNAMLRDFEKQRDTYRSNHPWPFIGPTRELNLRKTDDVRMICLVVGFWHDFYIHGYPLLTEQQVMNFHCFPYPPYRISVTNLEGYLIHIKRHLIAKRILSDPNTPLRDSKDYKPLKDKLPDSRLLALQSFAYAIATKRELVWATQSTIYEWLKKPENHNSENNPYHGLKIPGKKETWQSYLRDACRKNGTDTDQIRVQIDKEWTYADKKGHSVVDVTQIVYRSSQWTD